MTDSGLVLLTRNGLAEVEVACFDGCHDCAAQNLCVGNKQKKGRLSVKNPLEALPGDRVKIEIPEARYSQALTILFGGLLLALLFGTGGGYLLAQVFSLSTSLTSFAGLVAGLILGSLILNRVFRQKNKEQLYPVIVGIIKKGDCYGSA